MGLQAQPKLTHLDISEASFFARFLWLDAATRPYYISMKVLTQSMIFVFRWKTVWMMFSFCMVSMISVVHTGGYAVIQVKHRRDINLKLSVYF